MLKGEDKVQYEVVKWFKRTYPKYAKCLYHIPNGGRRSKSEAMKFKAIGVLAGVPDLILTLPDRYMYIELKDEGKKPSSAQIELHSIWEELGIPVYIFDNSQEAIKHISKWMLID